MEHHAGIKLLLQISESETGRQTVSLRAGYTGGYNTPATCSPSPSDIHSTLRALRWPLAVRLVLRSFGGFSHNVPYTSNHLTHTTVMRNNHLANRGRRDICATAVFYPPSSRNNTLPTNTHIGLQYILIIYQYLSILSLLSSSSHIFSLYFREPSHVPFIGLRAPPPISDTRRAQRALHPGLCTPDTGQRSLGARVQGWVVGGMGRSGQVRAGVKVGIGHVSMCVV